MPPPPNPPGERDDVLVVRDGCRVEEGTAEQLAAVAGDDAGVATVSAVGAPAPSDLAAVAAAARAVLAGTGPDLARPDGPCVLVCRRALDLVGGDDLLDPSGAVSAAFARRCRQAGLRHRVAPVAVTAERGWPDSGSVADAMRRARDGLRVGIDARMLTATPDGTRLHVMQLIAALAGTGRCHVVALTGDRLDPTDGARLQRLDRVSVVTVDEDAAVPADLGLDLVHRPFQLSAPPDLAGLAALAPRLVVTHQDLIAYRNPAYFASPAAWEQYRSLTRDALAVADHVVFFSEHARADALGETLVEAGRASVVHIGADHISDDEPVAPPPATVPDTGEVLLCLGSDYLHKNRLFALGLLQALQRDHGFTGRLVFAGPHVPHGSSREAERAFLAQRPAVAEALVDLGPVAEAVKHGLLQRCSLVLYPSVAEGFGLIPFEAAAADRACLWATGSALAEVLAGVDGGIVAWSHTATAGRAHTLLTDPAARAAHIAAVRHAAQTLPWGRTAERLLEVYAAVCAAPPSPLGAAARAAGALGGVSPDGMRLVGPHGVVPAELERPLLALFTRSWLARPVGSLLRATHDAARRRGG